MNKAPLPPQEPSVAAKIAAGIAGLVVLIGLFIGFYRDERKAFILPEIEAPSLESSVPRDWVTQKGFNLPPMGNLPTLQTAMQRNPELRRRVQSFVTKTDADIFANYKQVDADIAAILLLWGGADLGDTARTADGQDPRVAMFLRAAYAMGGLEPIVNNPRTGRDPWPRLFAHYKTRLIAQTPGGQAPFNNFLAYDIAEDRIIATGGLSRDFFSAFGAFLRGQPGAAEFRNNLLRYIEAINPPLSEYDRQTLQLVR